jgi:hypothetical protein
MAGAGVALATGCATATDVASTSERAMRHEANVVRIMGNDLPGLACELTVLMNLGLTTH